jgi:hypothetical protein
MRYSPASDLMTPHSPVSSLMTFDILQSP